MAQQRAALAQLRNAPPPDHAVRLAIAAQALDAAVARGAPYKAELQAAKALADDPKPLAPLDRFAEHGIPSAASLTHDLKQKIEAMQRSSQAATSGEDEGFLSRLQANAANLVRIRPVGEPPGANGSALGRAQAAAARGDITAARTALDKLPADQRSKFESWMTTADARAGALAASRQFAETALRALPQRTE
jgi:hypothetical protein